MRPPRLDLCSLKRSPVTQRWPTRRNSSGLIGMTLIGISSVMERTHPIFNGRMAPRSQFHLFSITKRYRSSIPIKPILPFPITPLFPNDTDIWQQGGERSVLNGDFEQENSLTECDFPLRKESRGLMIESDYNYGARAGVWRILRLFNERNLKLTMYVTSKAYERNPADAKSTGEHGHDNASHCYR